MTSRIPFAAILVLMTFGSPVYGQQPGAEHPAHDELRAVRDDMMAAFEERDVDRLLSHVHPDVLVTFQNAELCRGPEEVRGFFDRMMSGSDRVVVSLESNLEMGGLSLLYGDDTAVAFGMLNDEFALKTGISFSLASRWTATLVKEDGRWLVAAYHVSTDMFDNGVNDVLNKWASIKAGVVALIVGLVLGGLVMRFVMRARGASAG